MNEFTCECMEHSLVVNRCDDVMEFAVWYYGHTHYSIHDRLRHIWRIIVSGHPFADSVLLNKEGTTQLRDYLTEELREL